MSKMLTTVMQEALHYFLSQPNDPDCQRIAVEINEALTSIDFVAIRLTSHEGSVFEAELASGHRVYLSHMGDRLETQLLQILTGLESEKRKKLSLNDYRRATCVGSQSSPTQQQIDAVKVRKFSERGREIKDELDGLDLSELDLSGLDF